MFRSIMAALVVALFAAPALADRAACTPIAAGINPTEAKATDDFINLVIGARVADDATADVFVVPVASEARALRADVDVAPGAGDQWDVTVTRNGTATGLTCTISGTATSCADGSGGGTFAAGDDIVVLVSSGAGATDPDIAAELRVSFCLETK